MSMETAIRRLAGTLVLVGLGLGYFVSPWFLLIVAFVGVNLLQSTFTGFCPAETILGKCGVGRTSRSDAQVAGH
jgi:hypothetical protein